MKRPYPKEPHIVHHTTEELRMMKSKTDWSRIEREDAIDRGIALDPDNPERDGAWFKRARPASKVLHKILPKETADAMLTPKRGRPPKSELKEHINLRVDADILKTFRATGKGWQSRINEALREYVKTHRSA